MPYRLSVFTLIPRRTSCARGDTICLRPCKLTISSYLFARWHLLGHVGYLRHQQQVDLLTLKVVSESPCDVGYLCANFSLPRPLCSRVRPDVRDRKTYVRQKHRLMSPPCGGGGITNRRFQQMLSHASLLCYSFRALQRPFREL